MNWPHSIAGTRKRRTTEGHGGAREAPGQARGNTAARTVSGSAVARLRDQRLCVRAVAEAVRDRLLLLEVLVHLEEVLDLVAQLRGDVVHVRDAHPRGILQRHADDLVVRPLLVLHVEDADGPHSDTAAGEGRI